MSIKKKTQRLERVQIENNNNNSILHSKSIRINKFTNHRSYCVSAKHGR